MEKTIFSKIIDGEIPGKFAYEDEQVVVLHDINPKAPIHLLIIPRKPIPTLMDVTAEDLPLIAHIHVVAQKLANQFQVKGFRLINNCGKAGGQEVFHIHYHFLAGFEE
ncbi:histidine triad nucleotide-binding protein [Brevibacillus fulvus]|uniref:Histidine triad (HIT) family protein n=1 Tax=Brevibacillus fulvus TaxID=1125967 RepID=A0A939BRW3_9BACL|nr:histidine triad nucleotide-binding protein [Brevibacillus fulvus]MBM7589863.1 histidine triad (HIT) family protein [Brevibacillus fulvus]